MTALPDIDVFFDGDCPVCRFEVNFYRSLDRDGRIDWIDITALSDTQLPHGKTRDDLLGRFHVKDRQTAQAQEPDRWFIGVDAFARIWQNLPGFRHGAFLFRVPGLRQAAMLAYRLFLRWQRWHRRRRTKA